MKILWVMFFLAVCAVSHGLPAQGNPESPRPETSGSPFIGTELQGKIVASISSSIGKEHLPRLETGVRQGAFFWRIEDGSAEEFARFCSEQFISDPEVLRKTFERTERNLETIFGAFGTMGRGLAEPVDLDSFETLPVDDLFAKYSPGSHFDEDFFREKTAFFLLLNFPQTGFQEKIKSGPTWDPETWARARMMDIFKARVPATVSQKLIGTRVEADTYINEYYIHPGRFLDLTKKTLFPPDLKLITHWGLRDEIKSQYGQPDGLAKQEMIYNAMERILDGSIPREVIGNPNLFWDIKANRVFASESGSLKEMPATPEGNRRYEILLESFKANRALDPFYLQEKSAIERSFNLDRQISEDSVVKILETVASSELAGRVGRLIALRLKRPVRPFDVWYSGFKPGRAISETELDAKVKSLYPEVPSFQKALPEILARLGFSPERAAFVIEKVQVDPSRGAGHAMGPCFRGDKARLRTKFMAEGMNYKGFNIAVHEFGHNVEQVFSLYRNPHYLLGGVPNSALTECFAFVFQNRDLELLGATTPKAGDEAMKALDAFWSTWEISGVALAEIRLWHWMYDHPDATPEELKKASLSCAMDVWNRFYMPVLGKRDEPLLAIYSHTLTNTLYLADYPLGHIIQFQIEEFLKGKNLGEEMERMCGIGAVTPKLWMERAVGSDISPEPLLEAARKAVETLEKE